MAQIREDLRAAGREGTSKGLIALDLAMMFTAGGHTAAGAASLGRQLDAALDVALRGAAVAADPVDELRARRDSKRAG